MSLEIMLEKYQEHFGCAYPFADAGDKTDAEIVVDIEKCLEADKPAPDPVMEENFLD